MRKVIAVFALALSLAGCASMPPLGDISKVLTTTIANPVTPVTIYQTKSVYASAVDLANGYRDYCYARAYKALMADPIAGPVCKSRRSIVTRLGAADDKAAAAIARAEDFIVRNPTINAATVVREAWMAVTSFQGAVNASAASIATVQ